MVKLIHTMIRVRDLDASLAFYSKALDLRPSHTLDFPDFTLVYLRNGQNDSEIELTYNKDRTAPYTHGDGYGHVAVVVDNVTSTRAAVSAAGYTPLAIKEFKRGEELLARFFLHPRPRWLQIEILEQHGHYR
jgi:lactoylglutathione lyase